jgi:hypothetical protein
LNQQPLSSSEALVLRDALDGRETLLDDDAEPVRASVLRCILLGDWEALTSEPPFVSRSASSLQLRGARIRGALTLQDAQPLGNTTSCCALLLRDCRFVDQPPVPPNDLDTPPTIDLRSARIARLSIIDCVAHHIALDGANVLGDVDICGLRADHGTLLCRVSARKLRCAGTLKLNGSRLHMQPDIDPDPVNPAPFACDLLGAHIEGNLEACNRFHAVGGVCLPAHVGGDVWMLGVRILRANRHQRQALRAAQCHVRGSFSLRPLALDNRILRSHLRGAVYMFGLRVDGTLDFSGVILSRDNFENGSRQREVYLPFLSVGGAFYFNSWRHPNKALVRQPRCDFHITASEARIGAGGSFWLQATRRSADADPLTLRLGSAKISGSLFVQNRWQSGSLLANNLRSKDVYLDGRFDEINIAGAHIEGQVLPLQAEYTAKRLSAFECRFGGSATLVAEESLEVAGSEFDRQVLIHSKSKAPGAKLWARALAASRGAAFLGTWDYADISNGRITGKADFTEGSFTNIDMTGIEVQGDLLSPRHLFGRLSLHGARVSGSLHINDLKLHVRKRSDSFTRPTLVLADCTIVGDFHVRSLQRWPQDGAMEEVMRAPSWLEQPAELRLYARDLPWRPGMRVVELHRTLPTLNGDAGSRMQATAFLFRSDRTLPNTLSGDSTVVYEQVVAGSPLSLDGPDLALDYLKFFCGYIWADEGAFKILDSAAEKSWYQLDDQGDRSSVALLAATRHGDDWLCEATLAYGTQAFRATFKVQNSGRVDMISDAPVATLAGPAPAFSRPHREYQVRSESSLNFVYGEGGDWRLLDDMAERTSLLESIAHAMTTTEASIVESPDYEDLAMVNLQGCKCDTLDDNHGDEWRPGVRADLRGFSYVGLGEQDSSLRGQLTKADVAATNVADLHGRPLAYKRIAWVLALMKGEAFSTQPLEQLHSALRRRGDDEAATAVLAHKLAATRQRGPLFARLLTFWFLELPFLYGLSSRRAIASSALYLAVGTFAFDIANYGSFRVLPVGTNVERKAARGQQIRVPVLIVDSQHVTVANSSPGANSLPTPSQPDELPCGDQVESLLYALDVMLPLIDLKQEDKCTVSSRDTVGATAWRFFKAVYSIVGAYVSSMLILTVSGVLRRSVER